MNGSLVGPKKTAICRYFATGGTCFYGSECQFLHGPSTTPCLNTDLGIRDSQLSLMVRTPEGTTSPALDPVFQAFSPPSNLPAESKLKTYMNVSARTISPSSLDKSKMFSSSNSISPNEITSALSSLALDSARKTPNPGAAEFVPMNSLLGPSQLTHSTSTPSFSQFSGGLNLTPGTSPYSRLAPDTPSGLSLGKMESPGLSPDSSPLVSRRSQSPMSVGGYLNAQRESFLPTTVYQEFLGGTTYFYQHEEAANTTEEGQAVLLPEYQMYPGNPTHIEFMKPKANAPSFFLPDELRMDILHRQSLSLAQRNPEVNTDLPAEVDNYHNICPLEQSSSNGPPKSSTFGYVTSVYKATNIKNGCCYCLRRVHGFRLSNTKCMAVVDLWKKLQHSNLVHLREVFTTKAFGDHSMVFVYDYHAGAETLMNQYFSQPSVPTLNGFCSPIYPQPSNGLTRPFSHGKPALGSLRQHAGLLPESLIWAFVVQLSSVLRTIHAAGLACRSFEPSKILVMGKSRLRLNCCGIMDVLTFDSAVPSAKALVPHYQQEDLVSLGKLVLALACNTMAAIQRENLQQSMDLVSRNYSTDLRNLILYLLSSPPRTHSINDIMPMIGARFYTQLDAAQMRSDVIENELAKEVENGRLFRLLVKLGTVSERPEFHLDTSWSETGDRYMLKLFRDYLFHQVTKDNRPWIDMAHVVQALNKLDAGVPEKICLMSRDEQNILVVSYAELKQCLESSFSELLSATSSVPPTSSLPPPSANQHAR
ncbi:poly(A) specific ribonuclease subunit PAN3 isoform X2 [Rhipicephalus microplus]|uniref:poly(A) specific ribonuclease subunit PAN3 isoform X2 n=1 Tax=Rhipicephalus microplus TaxID=6941 RepID=UPI003F6C7BC9